MTRHKAPPDPRGGHVRVYWALLDSPAWRALSHADVRVYLAMRRKLGRTNNGDIDATLAKMKHAGISSSSTLATALHRLEALGFIEKTRQGGIAAGGKLCSLYRFTDEPTLDIAKAGVKAGPATDEWRKFTSIAEARAAVRMFTRKTPPKVRPSNRTSATIDAEAGANDSKIGHVADSPVRASKRARNTDKGLQAA